LISDVSAGGPVQVKRSADLALEIRQQLQVWSCREFGLSVRIVIDDQNKEKSGATSCFWSCCGTLGRRQQSKQQQRLKKRLSATTVCFRLGQLSRLF
jgi:hypothetical protein